MSGPTEYLAVAAIFALRAAASTQALPSNRDDFAQLVQDRYRWEINELSIEKIIRQLEAWDLITIIEDRYAGEMLRLFAVKSADALKKVSEEGHRELISKASAGGVEWFSKVFQNQKFWTDLYHDPMPSSESPSEMGEQEASLDLVPASDRIVSRSDNKAEIELIEVDVRGLADEIAHNNEASIELGDDRELIAGELKAAEVLISQPKFRLSRLASLVMPALRFLSDKFAAGAIGEMAKRLIAAILGLM